MTSHFSAPRHRRRARAPGGFVRRAEAELRARQRRLDSAREGGGKRLLEVLAARVQQLLLRELVSSLAQNDLARHCIRLLLVGAAHTVLASLRASIECWPTRKGLLAELVRRFCRAVSRMCLAACCRLQLV